MPLNLRTIRESRGLSQAELARRIDADKSMISRLESGRTRLASHHIRRLTAALDCRPDDLVADGMPLTDDERELIDRVRDLAQEDFAYVRQMVERLGRR